MSFVWIEGFETDNSTALASRKYVTTGSVSPQVAGGRLHGNAGGISSAAATTPSLGVDSTYTIGFGYKASSFGGTTTFFQLLLGGNAVFTLMFNASRQILLRRGGTTGTVLETGTTALPVSNWAYIEFKVTLSDSGAIGQYEVRIDTLLEMNNGGANIQTTPTGFNGADQFRFSNIQAMDDLYILNSNASGANDFLGDTVVEGLLATAAGALTQWSVTGTANHFTAVSDANDNTYINSDTNGQIDLFEFANLAFITGSIHAVQCTLHSRMELAAGSRVIRPNFRDSLGNVGNFPNATINGTTISGYSVLLENDPTAASPNPWSITEINNGQFGVEVVS